MSAYQYIIAVHGMGESRYGETVLPVISRCADVVQEVLAPRERRFKSQTSYENTGRDVVTLGAYVGASPLEGASLPWVTFEGIPAEKADHGTFTGIATQDHEGKLIRFVDMWWKDLIDDCEHVLEPVRPWTDGLIGRIQRLQARTPYWLPQLLFKLQDVLGPMQSILKMRVPDVEKLAFNKYLGDVQIYAEYDPMRGRAVRRFHERMDAVYKAHKASARGAASGKPEPSFHIVAHSLGTIMSLDALMYAAYLESKKIEKEQHGDKKKNTTAVFPNLPFNGYDDAETKAPDTEWIRYVKTFVTLGSPIDKFLLFWPYRYQYLNSSQWIDEDLTKRQKIRHINYCDEQDPVGQSLDTLQSTEAYQELFTATIDTNKQPEEAPKLKQKILRTIQMKPMAMKANGDRQNELDVVYHRCLWPGLAHTSYWKDNELFKNILEHVLLNKTGSRSYPNVVKDKTGMYSKITVLSYFIIPLALVGLIALTYDAFLEPESWKGYFLLGAIFVGTGWATREVVNLLVWWRQLLRNKRSQEAVRQNLSSKFVQWMIRLGLPLIALGFAQVAIDSSETYVKTIKYEIASAAESTPDGTTAKTTNWPELPHALEPFQLIHGDTKNRFAFWTTLISLLAVLTLLRWTSRNFRESSRYESYLSVPVDIIVIIIAYWLLLTLWEGDMGRTVISGNIWQHPIGLAALAGLAGWHLFTVIRVFIEKGTDLSTKLLKVAQKASGIFVSLLVLIGGWFLIAYMTDWIGDFLLQNLGTAARKRMTYFCFSGLVVWMYMAMRFYVAKVQLGSDEVPEFKNYFIQKK